jgi:hypothetical protein
MATRHPTAHARAVADAVTPIIADALALQRRLAAARAVRGLTPRGHAGALPLGVFAEQMGASAELLASRVREVGGTPHTRRTDDEDGPDAADAPRAAGETVRRLLAEEDRVADRVRHAIAACDAHRDERTANCLEEMLDELERQRSALRALAPAGPP